MHIFSDIAVSAPYEGSGVVYIYHSRADGSGLNPVSVQVRQMVPMARDVGRGVPCWFRDRPPLLCMSLANCGRCPEHGST